MFRIVISKILVVLLVVVLSATTVSYAQAEGENSPAQRVSILRNLGQFISTFFDLDNSFRFLRDDIFIKNQCLRRDIFALYSAKTAISDYLIENYTTIELTDLELQKKIYTQYSLELVFLRNLDQLKNPTTGSFELTPARIATLKQSVLDKTPSSYSPFLNDTFDSWINYYTPKLSEYAECQNSWTAVINRANNLSLKVDEIVVASTNLSTSFNQLGQTIAETPAGFYNNSRNSLRRSAIGSYLQTKNNFNSAVDDIQSEFQVFDFNPRSLTVQRLEEQTRLIGQGSSIGQSILSGNDLSSVSGLVADSLSLNQSRSSYIQSQTQLQVVSYFSDTSNLLFLQKLIDTNANLIDINSRFSFDQNGLVNLVEEVGLKQCSA